MQILVRGVTYQLSAGEFVDLTAELPRLRKDLAKVQAEAAALDRKLANAEFVARAAPEVVEETRDRLDSARAEVARLQAALARIG